ncbi:hypothetical protein FRB97_009375 [Tulasnella sp. 331]|nr:hypothetical protein FRB98_001869 [Tulasnella sp. 332]KAG8870769.1 hypothetical protein FRB97_009375 [Tulasnella sp. 331]
MTSSSQAVTQTQKPLSQTATSSASSLGVTRTAIGEPIARTKRPIGISSASEQSHVGSTPTMTGITTASTTISSMPEPAPAPTLSAPSKSASCGMSVTGIVALITALLSMITAMATVWQGVLYPMREHKKKETTHDVELQTAVILRKTAEELHKATSKDLGPMHQKAAVNVQVVGALDLGTDL